MGSVSELVVRPSRPEDSAYVHYTLAMRPRPRAPVVARKDSWTLCRHRGRVRLTRDPSLLTCPDCREDARVQLGLADEERERYLARLRRGWETGSPELGRRLQSALVEYVSPLLRPRLRPNGERPREPVVTAPMVPNIGGFVIVAHFVHSNLSTPEVGQLLAFGEGVLAALRPR